MKPPQLRSPALAAALAVAGLAALYAGALRLGFLNDDYLFLENARPRGLGALLGTTGALANYFRPLSRAVYFGLLTPLAGGHPLVFHAVNFALFLVAVALVLDLLRAFAPLPGAAAGTLYFALLPLQRVNLMWISCNQDLMALAAGLGALALFRRGRTLPAVLAYLAAVLSKESALPLPVLLFLWSWRIDGAAPGRALRRVAPFALPILAWAAGEWHLRAVTAAPARLQFDAGALAAGYAHLVQSLLGLDSPAHFAHALLTAGPSLAALALLAPLALALPAARGPAVPAAARRHALPFAAAWLLAFGLPVAPVAFSWSSYFYTPAAVGGALLVAVAAARLARMGWLVLLMALLWWHAAAGASPAFAVADDPWGWTSHLTPWYFERGARLSAALRAALLRVAPAPAHGTRFFFATLPPWAGFQMGNGAAIRELYRDDSLESHFYTRFDERTAGAHPCVFLFWNGVDFERLYAGNRDPFFQVGADLLLLDRPAGAAHAFRRGLAAGEERADNLYWLGWALRWSGRAADARAAWRDAGQVDDRALAEERYAAARTALARGDSTVARRSLLASVLAGIGRADAHAALGELLAGRAPKFALLETRVATRLAPGDWRVRRTLVAGLVAARLDDAARSELRTLRETEPGWRSDPVVAALERALGGREDDTRATGHAAAGATGAPHGIVHPSQGQGDTP